MSIPGSANLLMIGGAADAGYQIEQSLRFRGGQKLERTNSNDGSSRSFTLSYWVKKLYQGGNNMNVFGSNDGGSNWSYISYGESSGDDDQLIARSNGSQSGYSNGYVFDAQRKHRDPSAWQHHFIVVDKSAGTSKGYINGVLDEGEGGYGGTRSSNGWTFNKNMTQRIGVSGETGSSGYFEGYLAEFCFVDNSALSPTDFGEFDSTGSWVPIEPNVSSWGTNGWYLKFDPDASNGVGHDHSGNGNNWTASGFNSTSSSNEYDYSTDSPTVNIATFNPVYCSQNNAANRIDQAGLRFVSTGLGVVWSTMTPTCAPISSGKWYWEWSVNTTDAYIGIIGENVNTVSSSNTQSQSGTILYYSGDGNKRIDNSASSYGSSYNGGGGSDMSPAVGVALDKDNNTITFYRNGSSQGTINLSSSSVDLVNNPVIPVFLLADGTSRANFGQIPFKYTPPADHVALSASALADSEIASPGEHFNTAHYQGDGTSSNSITGIGFQPSFSWVKALSASNSHVVQDALRGLGGQNGLQLTPNNSFVEDDNGNGHIGSYDSDGFTLVDSNESGPYPRAGTNTQGENYIAWLWKGGGSSGTSNTSGSINSTVSANTAAGFSIVKYTSPNSTSDQTVGHGLGVKPHFIIVKNLDRTYNWDIYHHSSGYNASFIFNNSSTRSGAFSGEPTDTVFKTKDTYTHKATDEYIAYCFTSIEGFSKFGKYIGSGLSAGTFVNLGFTPELIIIKRVGTANWALRSPYFERNDVDEFMNPSDTYVYANGSENETTVGDMDFLSNGVKMRENNGTINTYGNTYVYAAWARNPFKTAVAR